MAKASIVAARQARAMEDQGNLLLEVLDRLERIEKILTQAMEPLPLAWAEVEGIEVADAEVVEVAEEPQAQEVELQRVEPETAEDPKAQEKPVAKAKGAGK